MRAGRPVLKNGRVKSLESLNSRFRVGSERRRERRNKVSISDGTPRGSEGQEEASERGTVVNAVVGGPLGIREPAHAARGLESKGMADKTGRGGSRSDPLCWGGNAQAEFHGNDVFPAKRRRISISRVPATFRLPG
jgi:hypothetical protein